MSAAHIAIYVAVLAFVVARRVTGRPARSPRELFLLPLVLSIIGYEDLSRADPHGADLVVAVVGAAISLGLGAWRGVVDRVEQRDGQPFVRWGAASVAIFAVNVAVKLALDGAGVALGGTFGGATKSLLFTAGVMLLGEAAVLWWRLQQGFAGSGDARRTAPLGARPVPRDDAWAGRGYPGAVLGRRREERRGRRW